MIRHYTIHAAKVVKKKYICKYYEFLIAFLTSIWKFAKKIVPLHVFYHKDVRTPLQGVKSQ